MDFTVAICTYDGAQRLPRVLDRLRQCYFYMRDRCIQLRWDVLVIDNNSRDQTPEVVANYQATGFADRPLRYVRETTQGLAYARQRAIEAASSPIIGFLDDDNLPEPNWVVAAHEFMLETPRAAAIGSRVLPEYEAEPPANFDRIRGFLALTDRAIAPSLSTRSPSPTARSWSRRAARSLVKARPPLPRTDRTSRRIYDRQ